MSTSVKDSDVILLQIKTCILKFNLQESYLPGKITEQKIKDIFYIY